jgi:acetyl-CoA acetyltransferase
LAHPYANVAIAAAFNTRQARFLEGYDSVTIALEAARGVLDEAGVDRLEVDAVFGQFASELVYLLGLGPVHSPYSGGGIPTIIDAANAIATGFCETVLVSAGGAGIYTERTATAPWTRPAHEFVVSFGMFTAVEFALIARRHMHMYGTKPEHLAEVAATIRNHGHNNPEAVYYGRGPYTPEDILASRMVADPFHLLDCSMTAEGGTALLLTTADRAADLRRPPVHILGGGLDTYGPSYQHPPAWDMRFRDDVPPNGQVGRRASQHAFNMAGLSPEDVDVCELYDPFSFEIIRQFEAFGFCEPGEGPDFVLDGNIGMGGRFPTTTDGGLMSFSHGGGVVQLLQRVVRGVQQLQGICVANQVAGAEVALCSNGGAGALFNHVLILGKDRP